MRATAAEAQAICGAHHNNNRWKPSRMGELAGSWLAPRKGMELLNSVVSALEAHNHLSQNHSPQHNLIIYGALMI